MSKKDYQLIADVIRELRIGGRNLVVATAFADRLEKDCPGFRRDVFLKACAP